MSNIDNKKINNQSRTRSSKVLFSPSKHCAKLVGAVKGQRWVHGTGRGVTNLREGCVYNMFHQWTICNDCFTESVAQIINKLIILCFYVSPVNHLEWLLYKECCSDNK